MKIIELVELEHGYVLEIDMVTDKIRLGYIYNRNGELLDVVVAFAKSTLIERANAAIDAMHLF